MSSFSSIVLLQRKRQWQLVVIALFSSGVQTKGLEKKTTNLVVLGVYKVQGITKEKFVANVS